MAEQRQQSSCGLEKVQGRTGRVVRDCHENDWRRADGLAAPYIIKDGWKGAANENIFPPKKV